MKETNAIVTNVHGEVRDLTDDQSFTFDDGTLAYGSCSVTFKNEMLVFGGQVLSHFFLLFILYLLFKMWWNSSYSGSFSYQITKVNNCRMELIGTLDNRLYEGSCFATETHIGLCFDKDEKRLCRSGTHPLSNFTSIELSRYGHKSMGWMSADQSKNY